ncbi:hypothetical protein L2E82_10902 [Cichorium intybus]|uniref:Uncharacterized protein n=1 Tax=Cichorium intybus TaxID=13427 RepID=A0ACB9GBC1_CICIN|nr:hypothetical protein L2E82_10902 [Cichorium intybus]
MADYQSPRPEKSSNSAMKRKKKRKLPDSEKKNEEKDLKLSRIDQSDDLANEPIEEDKETSTELLEDATPWRNLQLVLSLQKKNLNIDKKVELAYNFVKSSSIQVADDTTQPSQAVSFDRVIIFLNNWIQSTLISSEKQIRVSGFTPQFSVSGSCLDYRCWNILKFCLEEGMKLHISLSFSKDILKVIHCITKNMEVKDLNDNELTLYNTMLDCISLIFTSHGGVSNENLDLWIMLIGTVLDLVLKVVTNKLDATISGTIVLNLTCLVLDPFIKFLRLHPNKKNGFQDFVDKLLEPLLCLLHVVHSSNLAMSKLLKLIEEVFSQGLFHPSHIDGFLNLQSLSKYKPSDDEKPKDSKTVIRSYHRHLFDKLERLVVEKKALALFGEGEFFRLYVHCIKRQDGLSLSSLSGEIRKSLFDFFVQIMEPLLSDIDHYLQDEVELGSVLEDVHCTLKSCNSILTSLMQEKVYVRVDDTSEGACVSFLKLICDKITLLSGKIDRLVPLTFDVNSGICKEFVGLVAKEVVSCLQYLLEIDYEVLGNDLESLWLLMFSFGTLGHNLTSIIPEILHLGCHMVNLYSELRQVGTSVFSLCKALRRSISSTTKTESNHSESRSKSTRSILCSPELRLSIHNAVKSIPEGQVGLSIKELATDVSESLEWMKGTLDNSHHDIHFKSEVLGSALSEVYTSILDSLMVTTGNSSLVGVSLNSLMTIISSSLSVLISQPKEGVHEFLSIVSGRKLKFSNKAGIFIFFFRLYMSSRSIYRQAISLAPPNTSKKMSEIMRDSFTAYSGNDWLEKTEKDNGYFSWILQPSVSLLVIIEAVSDVCVKESETDFSSLTYVLNAMAIQRLVDLNRLVNSFEFVIKRNDKEEDGIIRKQNKRLGKRLLKLEEEARGLSSYITGHLSLLNKRKLNDENGWDFAVATIDNKSLPCAYWSMICQNIDIWSVHASKKKLKMFLSILLESSLPFVGSNFKHIVGEGGSLKIVMKRDISLELLKNTMLYEEKFVQKHMASRFCQFLGELVSPLFNNGDTIELQEECNWPEVLSSLEISSVVEKDSSNPLSIKKSCSKQEVDQSNQIIYTTCENSLDFLSWMPKRWINSKSFSLYATCILNLERRILGTLLGDKCNDHHELLKLFLCCRKTLNHLMFTFSQEKSQNSLTALHFKGKFPALWLLKSLLSIQHKFSKDPNSHIHNLIFSLNDHTSYVFLTLIKGTLVNSYPLTSPFNQEDGIKATNFMIQVSETLKDHAKLMLSNYGKAASVLACFHGFLWGLSSTLSHMETQSTNLKSVFSRRNFEPVDKLKLCIDTYTSFINKSLCELVLEDSVSEVSSDGYEKRLNLENLDMGIANLNININKSFLLSLLEGKNLEAGLFLRELFISYSAILKLNSQIKTPLLSKLVAIFIEVSEVLLSGFSKNIKTPSELTFVLLDGIVKFLEELGNHLAVTNPTLPTKVYERLIDLHLKAIGKCISLQGKEATLESHETESSTKTMKDFSSGISCLDECKSRLRVSFKVFVGKSSEVYISSAVQFIKKALIGRQEGGSMVVYQINTGSSGGGNVSSVVAAGIDCLDLVLEAITGRKSLKMVKTDILGSVSCLFNIILHLSGPQIFYKNPTSNTHHYPDPDPGSVILMCIEVLTKVSGKHALYQMDSCHVAQSLSIPATLFQNILQATTRSDAEDMNASTKNNILDQKYSVELYAVCCRMLHTLLRHHKRESLQNIALLQASVSVLLHCLEMVNNDQITPKGYLVWGLQEGVKCGAFLRRIYEEIRQQKDVIGQDCRLFLSTYIVVFSGFGPLKTGIKREIDEALRPGVYALIDACSPDDLQYIHTVLGEGPCRNTLANLQHDYKLNFQYEGKV